jgi:hypothetical protein
MTMWAAVPMYYVASEGDKALPAEVVAAAMTRHVVASALLLDVDAALGAGLCAHGLDLVEGRFVFLLCGFAAAGFVVPGTVAREAELVLAVRAGNFLLRIFTCAAATVLDREVLTAFGGEASDEVGAGGKVMLGKRGIVPVVVQYLEP